jgi:octaprenyl-diphosphate synthase
VIAPTGARPLAGGRALQDIQAPVRAALDRVPDEMWRIAAADTGLTASVAEHLMGMRGKMFRPTLVLLSSALEGPPPDRALTVAAVAELIHLATLIHDDSVDHSVLRRGQPTVNSVFSHQVSVLMGDYLYTRALGELVRLDDLEALRVVMQASNEMTLGELKQLSAFDALAFGEEDYTALIRAKTASLFTAVCDVGGHTAGGRHREPLARYGDRLGMAFQVVDDLLDYTEDAGTTGKPAGLDLREHKVTLPLIAALRTMSAADRGVVERLFATPQPDDALVHEVSAIVVASGGLDYARAAGDQYAREAEEALQELPEGPARSALGGAIGYVMERRS